MWQYLVIIILTFLIYVFFSTRKDPRLPPGIYGWPIIGTLPSLKVPIVLQIEQLRKRFGNVFLWRMGSRNIVYICDPKLIREVFSRPDLTDRPPNVTTFDTWADNAKTGLFNSSGLEWQSHRRFTLRHLRDAGLGRSSIEKIVLLEAESLVNDLIKNASKEPVDIPVAINAAAFNVITRMVADVRFKKDDEEFVKFWDSMLSVIRKIQGTVQILDAMPWLTSVAPNYFLNKIGYNDFVKTVEGIRGYLTNMVKKRKESFDRDHPCGLIDAYLLEIEKGESNLFSEKTLVTTIGDLLVAGSDTTASSLKWALIYLARHVEIQRKVQEEIDEVVPKDRQPCLDDKPNLPYTEAVVNETLRISSIAPIGVFQAPTKDINIGKFFIPKGTTVYPFLYGCHRNPEYWERPNDFYPEHFLDSEGKFKGDNIAFMPFGYGRRVCLGESLAKTELFIYLTNLLQKFSFGLPEGETYDFERDPTCVIIEMPPKIKLHINYRDSNTMRFY